MSVCQQRDISALSLQPAFQWSLDGRDRTIGKVGVLYGQWHNGKSAVTPHPFSKCAGRATKDMGKMLGGEEEKDPDAQKKEEERQEALRQQEEERKAKYAKMEAERENIRQGIRDKYGIKKKEEKEAEAAAAMEQASEGSLTRPKKAVPTGCGDEEEEESIVDTVMKFIPAPLMDMFNKK
ncbi:Complexin-1 [Ameca splendens]|uniref:Complexin-1 n=1 Tax=Ameca splendens TaxID=208324 RepID=A0ABV0YDI9_9TELE